MNVLVACEESQEICKAFRARAHNAFSCGTQVCSGGHPEWHIQGDARKILNPELHNFSIGSKYGVEFTTMNGDLHFIHGNWDMIVAPPELLKLNPIVEKSGRRLIDANELNSVLKDLGKEGKEYWFTEEIKEYIVDYQPTVDAEPVVHACWVPHPVGAVPILNDDDVLRHYHCSRCGRIISCLIDKDLQKEFPYCHCGAKMDEVVK